MSVAAKLRRAPGRVAAGTFILNSGVTKLQADEATAKELHGVAVGAYPFLGKVEPKSFARGLGIAEVTVGGALLLPIVPAGVAGAALAVFSGGLLGLYWHTPGMHSDGDPRPTQEGVPLAKDVWIAGIAAGLLMDVLVPEGPGRWEFRRAERRATKAEARVIAADAALKTANERGRRGGGRRRQAKASQARLRALEESALTHVKAQVIAAGKTAGVQANAAHSALDAALDSAKDTVRPVGQSAVGTAQSGLEAAKAASHSTTEAAKSAAVKARNVIG